MEISNSEEKIAATIEWMSQKYDELNEWLFNGKLGTCKFEIYKKGYKSLGHFRMGNRYLKANRYTRQMFIISQDGASFEYIKYQDFARICQPIIGLNGNYKGTEKALLSTLLHEMCHYYTYMGGHVPAQAHGPEFRHIAELVSFRSNGTFSIQRLANAEEMKDYELESGIADSIAKKKANKVSKLYALVGIKNSDVLLMTSSNMSMISSMSIYFQKICKKVYLTNDPQIMQFIASKGYYKNIRSQKYYRVTEKSVIDFLSNSPETKYDCRIIKDSDVMDLKDKKVASTVNLNEYDIRNMVKEVLNKTFGQYDNDNAISIDPDMDLGQATPFDYSNF